MIESLPIVDIDNPELQAYCRDLRETLPDNGRILLVQIPQVILSSFNREIALKRGYYAYPPTGLQYLYEAIKHRGLDVRILDLNYALLKKVFDDPCFVHNDWPLLLEDELDSFDPGIVGVSCLFDLAIGPMIEVLERIRKRNRSVVIAGGVIATYEWKALLARNLAHFVVKGEGENKLNYLLDHLTPVNNNTKPTPGIYFNNGEIKESRGIKDVVHVHGNLRDSYNLISVEKYSHYGGLNPYSRQTEALGYSFAAIQFSRGCRGSCTFCSVRDFMGKGVRARSVDDVFGEMAFLYEEKGVRHFEWLDDDLLFNLDGFKELLRRIINKGWKIYWSANNGLVAKSIDDELMDLIQQSGCIGFKVGIETGNEAMLKQVKKPGTHKQFLELSRLLRSYPGPFVGGNFIIGLPNETFGQMMDSFRFALEVDLDWSAFTLCAVIRGASAFSDSGEYFDHQMKTDGANVVNFIPTRESTNGVLKESSKVKKNTGVFLIAADEVPTAEQAKEIWFAFNIIVNYICNKNLRTDGHPAKFISWVESARRAYPSNPYMLLFLAIGYKLLGKDKEASQFHSDACANVDSDYWQERFAAFYLNNLLNEFPKERDAIIDSLGQLRAKLFAQLNQWLSLERGVYPPISN